jgi:predicted nucleotide-binding protein (sugar kinase/HSP70/actin superfamily)
MEKYTEINLLVHPFFDLISYLKITSSELDIKLIYDNKDFKIRYKKSLMAWGEVISKMSPHSVLILLEPSKVIKGDNRFFYEEIITKFYKFAKNKIKDRFIVITSDNLLLGLNKELINKFDKKVKINAFGEYTKMCVKTQSKELKKILKVYGKTAQIEIIETKSLYSHADKNKGLGKLFLQGHERRKRQIKIKRK